MLLNAMIIIVVKKMEGRLLPIGDRALRREDFDLDPLQ